MSSRAESLAAIATVAGALGELASQVVFVGGTVVALYPLEGGADVRPTIDVDCVVNVATTDEYYAFVAALRTRGFTECTDEGAPICRFVCADIRVDLMPKADTALGPTNKWYRDALREAATHELSGSRVLAITPPYFVATKLEAFRSRGNRDYVASPDLEDVLAVLGGLPSLRDEIASAVTEISSALRGELASLMESEAFVDALPGHFEGDAAGQARAHEVTQWLRELRAASAGRALRRSERRRR